MTSQWPKNQWDNSETQDIFQLVQNFELHCAQVYDHAASHPEDAASADYVMQLALQAYQTVHSLHMQKVASSYCNIDVAAAALESKVVEYRKSQQYPPCQQPNLECTNDDSSALGTQTLPIPGSTLEDLIEGEFDDEESDSDWEESEEDSDEESDDDYYEYYEGSEADSDLEDIVGGDEEGDIREEQVQPITTDRPTLNIETRKSEDTPKATSLPSSSILRDTKMNDSILAALQNMSFGEPDHEPSAPAETQIEPPSTASTVPPTDDTHSETTAVQTQSNREPSRQSSTTVAGMDEVQSTLEADRGYEKSPIQVHPDRIPRRLKTVCYKYIRRAMVPIRGKAH